MRSSLLSLEINLVRGGHFITSELFIMSIVSNKSIETFLRDSGFIIHSKYLTNTKYVKEIGDFGKLLCKDS